MTAPFAVVTGRCQACGRLVPGVRREVPGLECVDPCPRCGVKPLMLDNVGPYTGNIAEMDEEGAYAFMAKVDTREELETLMRIEYLGPDRDDVQLALVDRYWNLNRQETGSGPAKTPYTLSELRYLWGVELANPDSLRMYRDLMRAN